MRQAASDGPHAARGRGIALEGIDKFHGAEQAIRGADLEIADGEFVAFVGPSGCGKSTLLRMIAGLEEISDGVLRIGERVVNAVEPRARDVAMVFQDYALYPHMTVAANIGFGPKMRGVSASETDRRVRGAASMLQMNLLDGTLVDVGNGAAVQIGSCRLPIDPVANVPMGEGVWLGLRPEHLELGDAAPLAAEVELIEATGSDKLVPCSIDGQELTARIPADREVSIGERLRFGIARARMHLFDRSTSMRLGD